MNPLFFLSFLLSMTITWLLVHNRLGINLLDHPNQRSLHVTPTPRSGGLAIATTLILLFLINIDSLPDFVISIAIGASIILAISIADDIKHVPSLLRLFFHSAAAGWLVYSGYGLNSIGLPGGGEIDLPRNISWAITLLLLIWMTNLYNFMDGMDGFAGGMTVIGFSVFAIVYFAHSQLMFAASMFIVMTTLGFLVFNFPPAKIFMGDSGSSVLGFLAAAFMLDADKSKVMPIWLSIILFSPFIVDATITLAVRILKKQKIWVAHKQHYYQRLVGAGWSHRKTVLSEYCLMLVCGLLVLAGVKSTAFIQILIVGIFAILYICIIIAFKVMLNKTA